MRRFELFSKRDPSGGVGTGIVAIGVEFPSDEQGTAWVALKWLGANPGIAFWPSVDDLLEVHGHLGAAEVLWLDPDEADQSEESSAETTQCHQGYGALTAAGKRHT
ncbi:hypothetical protein ACWF0M_14130 [Kribbella sp. NPDC055110]